MLITVSDDMTSRRNHPSTKTLTPSSTLSTDGGPERRRLRILRLQRPPSGSYGFHLRGGREHGTGFFISHVEPNTEAFAQGLRTGDQVLRVNDLNVSGALHKEVASLVRVGTEVILHVKSTGLIPVKNNPDDPLSWVLVDSTNEIADPLQDQSNTYNNNKKNQARNKPIQIIVSGAGKHTLGCSICKGPPEKPGIFVQRVRERGIAEEAGLRPGDQILSCNGVSLVNTDFQQAVQAMKSSPYLQLEVVRGAGLELVAGESSGYNSSASSETGEELYPPSEAEFIKDDYMSHTFSSTLTRLHGARDRIQLDTNRDWKDIEAEWADAEVNEKRNQLETSHTKLVQQSSKTKNSPSVNKSIVNLTINEDEENPATQQFQNRQSIPGSCNTCSHLTTQQPSSHIKRTSLTKPRSMTDLRMAKNEIPNFRTSKNELSNLRTAKNDASNYRIAMQMAADEHVSKIVIPSAPKDEQNALLRLEELSSGSKSSSSTPLQGSTPSYCHSKTCSISSTSSEESGIHRLAHNYPRPNLSSPLKDNRQLLRCRSNPPANSSPTTPSSEDSDSLLSFPSSTISLHKSASGRFTSKIQIRSSPPPPPPRGNATKLTRQHRNKLKCGHRKLMLDHPSTCSPHSPPTSPCTSSASSADNVISGTGFRRRQSLESLSASSDESSHCWDDYNNGRRSRSASNQMKTTLTRRTHGIAPPPPPPPPNPSIPSIIPPPPPLPPTSQVPSTTEDDRSSFCNQILSRQQEINGAASKLKSPNQRPEVSKKPSLPNPKQEQHEKLMEEFKRAHALMVAKRQAATPVETTSC